MERPKNEVTFPIVPIGIKYVCEFCREGEMRAIQNGLVFNEDLQRQMYNHRCDKCEKELQLPKAYPYIEWAPMDGQGGKFLDLNGLKHVMELLKEELDNRYELKG